MKKAAVVFCSIFFVLSTVPAHGSEKTGYVTDQLFLTLRTGPGRDNDIINRLKSNDSVRIISEQDDFFEVKTAQGETGWVEKQYIVFEAPEPLLIDRMKQSIDTLQEKINALEEQNRTLIQTHDDTQKESELKISSLEAELAQALKEKNEAISKQAALQKQYESLAAQSRQVTDIRNRNTLLEAQNRDLTDRIQKMESRIDDQFKAAMIKWFLAGVGVLLIGWLMGRSIASERRKSGGLLD